MKSGKRLHGLPTRGSLKVLVFRVRQRIKDEKELKPHHVKRVDDMLRRTVKTLGKSARNRLLALREEVSWYLKVFDMAKKTLKTEQPTDEFTAVQRAAMYYSTVEELRRGTQIPGYTLIPSKKAEANTTVEVVINLGDGWSLCRYVSHKE